MKTLILTAILAGSLMGCMSPLPNVQRIDTLPTGQTVTNYVQPSGFEVFTARAAEVIQQGETINAAIPSPYQLPITIALGSLSAALGYVAKRKNDNANKANKTRDVIILGVERAGDANTKKTIQDTSLLVGVSQDVATAVSALTSAKAKASK